MHVFSLGRIGLPKRLKVVILFFQRFFQPLWCPSNQISFHQLDAQEVPVLSFTGMTKSRIGSFYLHGSHRSFLSIMSACFSQDSIFPEFLNLLNNFVESMQKDSHSRQQKIWCYQTFSFCGKILFSPLKIL